MEFKDKFIGFVDILGFKSLVEAAEASNAPALDALPEVLKKLDRRASLGLCPESDSIDQHLDFRVTQVSDCVVVSCEVSPSGVVNLVGHCWGVVIELLQAGFMCRGFITRGSICHTNKHVVGSGYAHAISRERSVSAFKRQADERGTPFVEVDGVVCDYVRDHGDECVQKMFHRHVEDDGEVVALFPFKRLAHSFVIAGFGHRFDPDQERQSNQNMRTLIHNLKERVREFVDQENSDAVRKSEHYIRALDAQLEICDQTDRLITGLDLPIPRRRL